MTDLVERLRNASQDCGRDNIFCEAADEIERMRQSNKNYAEIYGKVVLQCDAAEDEIDRLRERADTAEARLAEIERLLPALKMQD